MDICYEQFKIDKAKHVAAGALIEQWSQSGSMRPIRQEDLPNFPYSVLAFSSEQDQTLLGHIAITSCEGEEAFVGGLVVNPDYTRLHIGLRITKYFLSIAKFAVPEMKEFTAYANLKSDRLFFKAGGVGLGMRNKPDRNGCNWKIGLTTAVESYSPARSLR
jgi:hypothetical protein